MVPSTCQEISEKLPWLLNGSLGATERQELMGHLSSCDTCLQELDETLCAWQFLTQHIPSFDLAAYSQGLKLSGPDREQIEKHLALCTSCHEELQLALADRIVDIEARRKPISTPGGGSWRRILAATAAISAILLSFSLIWTRLDDRSAPSAHGAARQAPAIQQPEQRPADRRQKVLFDDKFESGSTAHWSESRGSVDHAQPLS